MINNGLKTRVINTLSALSYQDSKLMLEITEYCKKYGASLSMIDYVSKNFAYVLNKFPKVKEEYIKELKLNNKKNRRQ